MAFQRALIAFLLGLCGLGCALVGYEPNWDGSARTEGRGGRVDGGPTALDGGADDVAVDVETDAAARGAEIDAGGSAGVDMDAARQDGRVHVDRDGGDVDMGTGALTDAGDSDASVDAAMDAGDAGGAGDAGDPDVGDDCPGDPDKTAPGQCGCGIPENCTGLTTALVHRYRFDGTGSTILDSVGGADGRAQQALSGSGALELSGNSSDYARLPGSLLGALSSATVELWLNWTGGAQNQPAISFGTATPNQPSGNCPGSTEYHEGSWYRFCRKDGSMTWTKARGVCVAAGGYLVAIESESEDQYLDSHPQLVASTWIGANDIDMPGQWYFATEDGPQALHFWSGGENGGPVASAFSDWWTGAPHPSDDDDTNCAYLDVGSKAWVSFPCDNNDGDFVCEWRGHSGSALNRGVSFTPSGAGDRPILKLETDAGSFEVGGQTAFPTGVETHVALVFDPSASTVALYIDGTSAGEVASGAPLSILRDADNWLGRSHLSSDPPLLGSYTELRIHGRALSATELATSHAAGPDPAFLE